jgi:hypothetical protein
VVDAKKYRGRVEVVEVGAVFRPELRLMVDGRDQTAKLVRGGQWQADLVRGALDPTYRDVPVYRALCFVDGKRRAPTGRDLPVALVDVDAVLSDRW